jgi:hypothetical protein
MNTTHDPQRIIAGALLSGGLVLAGLGLGAGAANADPGYIDPIGPDHWCLGAALGCQLGPEHLPHLLARRYRGR